MIDKVLEERGSRYGEYKDVSRVSQELKLVIQKAWKKNKAYHTMATYPHTESLDMICNKIARAVCGDPMYIENWRDIIGYSQLVIDEINKSGCGTDARVVNMKQNEDKEWVDTQLVLNEIEDKDIQAHEVHPMVPSSMREPQVEPSFDEAVRHYEATKGQEAPQTEKVTLLSDFLKENNCYNKFIENFDENYDENWKFYIENVISSAFSFGLSKQRLGYWNDINSKWVKIPYANKENDMLWLLDEDTVEEYQHSTVQSGAL